MGVDLLLQQVGGKAVAQGVHRDAFVDTGHRRGRLNGAIELARAQGLNRVFSPGNSQPPSSILPWARATRHQTRRRSSSTGESIA